MLLMTAAPLGREDHCERKLTAGDLRGMALSLEPNSNSVLLEFYIYIYD